MDSDKIVKLIEKGKTKAVIHEIDHHSKNYANHTLGYFLVHAVQQKNMELIDFLLERCPEEATLTKAIRMKDAELAAYLIQKGVPTSKISYWDRGKAFTPLITAVEEGSLEIVKLLVECGADINMELQLINSRYCALSHAMAKEKMDIAAYLVEKGADIPKIFSYAATWGGGGSDVGEAEAVRAFFRNKRLQDILLPKIYDLNEEACSFVFFMIFKTLPYDAKEYEKYITLFLDHKAKVNADSLGMALFHAVHKEVDMKLIRRLIDAGADLNKKVYEHGEGEITALQLAEMLHRDGIAGLLKEKMS